MATLENNVFVLNKYVEAVLDGAAGIAGWNTAWIVGGFSPSWGQVASVGRFSYQNDTADSIARSSGGAIDLASSSGNNTDSWISSGRRAPGAPGIGATGVTSSTSRLIFANDTTFPTAKGNLDRSTAYAAGTGKTDSSNGWIIAGNNPANDAIVSNVSRIIFASDTAAGVSKGPVSLARNNNSNAVGNTTDAWFGGGYNGGGRSTVDRIIFSADTATAVAKGPLTGAHYGQHSFKNTTIDGYFVAGYISGNFVTTSNRIIFSSDTATAVAKGPTPINYGYMNMGASALASGYIFSSHQSSRSSRMIFSTDTATMTNRGNMGYNAVGYNAIGQAATF